MFLDEQTNRLELADGNAVLMQFTGAVMSLLASSKRHLVKHFPGGSITTFSHPDPSIMHFAFKRRYYRRKLAYLTGIFGFQIDLWTSVDFGL